MKVKSGDMKHSFEDLVSPGEGGVAGGWSHIMWGFYCLWLGLDQEAAPQGVQQDWLNDDEILSGSLASPSLLTNEPVLQLRPGNLSTSLPLLCTPCLMCVLYSLEKDTHKLSDLLITHSHFLNLPSKILSPIPFYFPFSTTFGKFIKRGS